MNHYKLPLQLLVLTLFMLVSADLCQATPLFIKKDGVKVDALTMINAGRDTFRFDTFGDEAFWGDTLGLHKTIEGTGFAGGIGPGLSPAQALGLGLKVDVDALPKDLQAHLKKGIVDLNSPATTLALLKLNAVVGVTGFFNPDGSLKSIGIQCALCHSTVDNSFAAGIGHRLDGWGNRDLNVGAIIAFAPDLSVFVNLLSGVHPGITQADVRAVLNSWGPGKFDAELALDGLTTNPVTGRSSATLLPNAFGLLGVNLHTWTGWGSVTHWNAFVAVLEMHGKGTFSDARLNNAEQFPVAAAAGFANVTTSDDHITPKLAGLQYYQLSLVSPPPPAGSFDVSAAARGEAIFKGKARCATCHVPPLFVEPGWNMHTPAEVGIEAFQANRAPDLRYRTSPLKGLWTHNNPSNSFTNTTSGAFGKNGYYHDGRFATLLVVVNHYDTLLGLGLTDSEKSDLVQFLLSI